MKIALLILAILIALVIILLVIGYLIPKGHVASSRVTIPRPASEIWPVVSDVKSCPDWWKSVKSVERAPDQNGNPVFVLKSSHGPMPLAVIESIENKRFVTKIASDKLPFGGSWTYELAESGGVTTVTVTERGEIYNPIFRLLSRIMGYHATLDSYLTSLADHFGSGDKPVHVPAG